MQISDSISHLCATVRQWRRDGLTVGFVPTMGNLHAGHIQLVEEARKVADRVVVSIFVNPSQFGPTEDFERYPRTPTEDMEKLRGAAADLLFLPSVATIYPSDSTAMTFVEVPGLSDDLCGQFRPGHFRGVATVVLKLFNLVQPDVALFGEKDYQQLTIIRRMVRDLNVAVEIIGVPTVREADGLAMSSRNAYLLDAERPKARLIHASLVEAREKLAGGNSRFVDIEKEQAAFLNAEGFRTDYFAIRRLDDLSLPKPDETRLIVLVAAYLGRTRLIDNLQVG